MNKTKNLKLQMLIPIVIVTILVIFVDVAYRSFSEEKRAKNEIATLKTLKIESADDWNRELTKIEEGKLKELGGNITAGILKSLIMIILIVVVANLFFNKVARAITELREALEKGANGDLTSEITSHSDNELGAISNKINEVFESLSKSLEKAKILSKNVELEIQDLNDTMIVVVGDETSDEGIVKLNDYISKVLDNVRNQTASSEESLAALQQISATVQNMSTYIENTVNGFQNTLELSTETVEIAETVKVILEDKLDSINAIVEAATELKTDLNYFKTERAPKEEI